MTSSAQQAPSASIHPATEMGALSLAVADLERSLSFYTEAIGFTVLERGASQATLGVARRPLLFLTEEVGAAAWPRDRQSYTGLYHFAILVPTRADLGRWLQHWLDLGYPVPGQGDHLVSEALYLEDPDGNGIEIYRDRPRDTWQWDGGQVRMATDPVDIRSLLQDAAAANEPWTGMPAGTRIGHIHLQVADIPEAERFYHNLIGFDVVVRMPTALFISAGGYHHHLGMNTWHSRGSGPAPAGTAGLRHFTVDLASTEARDAVIQRLTAAGIATEVNGDDVLVHDPWSNVIRLRLSNA